MAAEEVCGKCGGSVVERLPSTKRSENIKHHLKKCSLCKHEYKLHHNCVTKLCKEYSISISKPNDVVTPSYWVQSKKIPFRCRLCETPCFVCQKKHKGQLGRYITDCTRCKKTWCYMIQKCADDETNKICINCVDTTNYKKVLHTGTHKIPFWCEKDVVLPNNVTFVSNIQWGGNTKSRRKGMEFAIRRKSPTERNNQECCSCNPLNYRNDEVNTLSDSATKNLCCSNVCELHGDYVECPKTCLMGDNCGNNRITNGLWKRMLVVNTDKKGLGVKALDDIKKFELIGEYTGVAVTRYPIGGEILEHNNYMMDYENPSLLSAINFGSVLRFVNHSCEPNSYVQRWKVNKEERVCLFALKNIKVMEEITFDYKWETRNEKDNEKCFCFSSTCRGNLKKVVLKESVEIHCEFASFCMKDNKSLWTIDPGKIRTVSEHYNEYCDSNDIDSSAKDNTVKETVSYRSYDEWTSMCDKAVKYLGKQMKYQHHKESNTKLIECYSGYLDTNVGSGKCNKNLSIKEVYNTLYFLFVPISYLHGVKEAE